MTKIILWEMTEGTLAGQQVTTFPAPQSELAQTRPDVEQMTESEYIDFIIQKDVLPYNPKNIRIVDATSELLNGGN
jgi:hypothetical protein